MWDRWRKKTFTVICCLADRELSEWSARCFMAAGLNSIACCTLGDLEHYAGWVDADAVVLDATVCDAPLWGDRWQRWALAGGVACMIDAAPAAEVRGSAASVHALSRTPPDLVFSKPLNCDLMAHSLMAVLRQPAVPADLRAGQGPARVSRVLRLDQRWCRVQPLSASGVGAPIELSAQEYRLLHALLQQSGEVLSRETLLSALAKGGTGVETLRSVDQVVRRLRDALTPAGLSTALATVRGQGYAWLEPMDPVGPEETDPSGQ